MQKQIAGKGSLIRAFEFALNQEETGKSFFASSLFLQQCLDESMIPDVTVFNLAYLIEKDLNEFYAKMAENSDNPAKEAFAMLARWKKGHEKFFKEYRDKPSEVY